jgi:hypothetical protein
MKTQKSAFKLLAILLVLCVSAFAQTAPSPNTEAELLAKQKTLQSECAKIARIVPCAVGIGDVDKLPAALQRSERDARYKLAQSVKVFVSYAASDSSWIEDGIARELSQMSGKISIDSLALVNSATLKTEYGVITDETNGKKFHRVLTLMVLNPQLYAEAQNEMVTAIAAAEPQSSSSLSPQSSSSQAVAATQTIQPAAKAEMPKIDYKKIATKTAVFLLNIAKRVIGL